jgi:chromosome segregation ATPase
MSQELQELRAALEAERAEHAITRAVLAATQAALDTEAQAHYSTNEELQRFVQAHADAVRATLQYMAEVHQLEDRVHAAEAELDDALSAQDGALAARDDAVAHAMSL